MKKITIQSLDETRMEKRAIEGIAIHPVSIPDLEKEMKEEVLSLLNNSCEYALFGLIAESPSVAVDILRKGIERKIEWELKHNREVEQSKTLTEIIRLSQDGRIQDAVEKFEKTFGKTPEERLLINFGDEFISVTYNEENLTALYLLVQEDMQNRRKNYRALRVIDEAYKQIYKGYLDRGYERQSTFAEYHPQLKAILYALETGVFDWTKTGGAIDVEVPVTMEEEVPDWLDTKDVLQIASWLAAKYPFDSLEGITDPALILRAKSGKTFVVAYNCTCKNLEAIYVTERELSDKELIRLTTNRGKIHPFFTDKKMPFNEFTNAKEKEIGYDLPTLIPEEFQPGNVKTNKDEEGYSLNSLSKEDFRI